MILIIIREQPIRENKDWWRYQYDSSQQQKYINDITITVLFMR